MVSKFTTKIAILAVFCCALFQSCQPDLPEMAVPLNEFTLAPGFHIECVAAEPLVNTPVAMAFDEKNRLWVAEMPGYMPNVDGMGEDEPVGAIVRLEDKDGDGQMDTRHVFLDGLVLVRALAFANGGLLYAEPPNLFWVGIGDDDLPGEHILIDSSYAPGDNPEYQANGLVYNLDNWYYSADSEKRYQCRNGHWFVEPTLHRGQWGITHDAWGKLFYNHNSVLLYGDFFQPNLLERNPSNRPKKSLRQVLTHDQRVFPAHATLVNRGYQPGVLDSAGRVVNVTSACGPHVFLGENFPAENYGSAFVCSPDANLVKQILLDDPAVRLPKANNGFVTGAHAFEGSEFLTSTDDSFRPVNLTTGPDGCLYLADMRRGIIQHQSYMTRYLRTELQRRGMDTLVGRGRIYRIVADETPPGEPADFSKMTNTELLEMLGHANGHLRLTAQRLLIERQATEQVPALRQMVAQPAEVAAAGQIRAQTEQRLHALCTLDGLNAIDDGTLLAAIASWQPHLAEAGIRLLRTYPPEAEPPFQQLVFSAMKQEDKVLRTNLLAVLGELRFFDMERRFSLLKSLLEEMPGDTVACEAAISGLGGQERLFYQFLRGQEAHPMPTGHLIFPMLQAAIDWRDIPRIPQQKMFDHNDARTTGLQLYRQYCANCHRLDGSGTPGIAPPLLGSVPVNGPWGKLANVIWYGKNEPVLVDSQLVTFPEPMAAFKDNPAWDERMLNAVVEYVKNAFAENQ